MPAKGEQIVVYCAASGCGKSKEIPIGKYNKSSSKIFFCDRDCQGRYKSEHTQGKNHHNFNSLTVCCSHCKNPISVNKARYDKQENYFCGYICQARWRSENRSGINSPIYVERVKVKCAMCEKEKEVTPYLAQLHELHFCDKWCQGAWKSIHQRGENSGNWVDGSSRKSYPFEWNESLRQRIKERDNFTCQLCGATKEETVLDVHHIDNDKQNCDEENLITLCHGKCHGKTKGTIENRERWQIFFESMMMKRFFRREAA